MRINIYIYEENTLRELVYNTFVKYATQRTKMECTIYLSNNLRVYVVKEHSQGGGKWSCYIEL